MGLPSCRAGREPPRSSQTSLPQQGQACRQPGTLGGRICPPSHPTSSEGEGKSDRKLVVPTQAWQPCRPLPSCSPGTQVGGDLGSHPTSAASSMAPGELVTFPLWTTDFTSGNKSGGRQPPGVGVRMGQAVRATRPQLRAGCPGDPGRWRA